ncbi:hypothetical protein HJ526_09340 [Donghicola sp. C2-DW-16]|uniref:Curlin n=1 Tax=Donghicola mangrovi TaxID=2729614 RepID=A0ABX2PFC2_9RHOB|nr:hypothetical protein [Donghicola mangrovi]NVO27621.1 hypothetical protein [Donghicola mangrovi]
MRRPIYISLALIVAGAPVLADGNKIYLTQSAPFNGNSAGNTINVDQSAADFSLIGLESNPALQAGRGNSADILVEGYGSEILLRQENNSTNGNTAALYTYGMVDAALTQSGEQNIATLRVMGPGMTGQITQDGNLNQGTLNAVGIMGTATLEQIGSNIDATLNVEAYYGHVNYAIEGSNLRFANEGPTIRTFGQTVNIRQSALGLVGSENGRGNQQ